MVQVLKADVKDSIVKAAKKEILKNGFDKFRMRNIADGASMTVGNLYRYYKNKDELLKHILEDAYHLINTVLKRYNMETIDFEHKQIDEKLILLKDFILTVSYDICSLWQNHQLEMQIMINDETYVKRIINWTIILLKKVNKHFSCNLKSDLYIQMSAIAIYEGLKYAFFHADSYEELREISLYYLKENFSKFMDVKGVL